MTINKRLHQAQSTYRTMVLGVLAGLSVVLLLGLASLAFSQDATMVEADTSALVIAESPDYGQFLTDNSGRAIYIFLNDTSGVSMCEGNCLQNWPPVLVPSMDDLPTLPEGMDAGLLGAVERPDDTFQLTYNGWPLYYFVADTEAGMTAGQGQGEVWYLLSMEGTGVGLDAGQLGGGAAP